MTKPTHTVPTENPNAVRVGREISNELVATDQELQELEDEKTANNKQLNDQIKKLKKKRRTLLGEIKTVMGPQTNLFIEGRTGAAVTEDNEEEAPDLDAEAGAEEEHEAAETDEFSNDDDTERSDA
jgi:hypothetical protein